MDKEVDTTTRIAARLAEVAAMRSSLGSDELSARRRVTLRLWQSERLAATHADLLSDRRYGMAADFFLAELYGAKDASKRDADVARVVPALSKYLPESGVETVADAIELDFLSESLDAAMVEALGPRIDRLDSVAYAAAYRAVGRRADREHQIDLVWHLGHALDRLTKLPFSGTALKLMRKPAAIAGLGELQAFLETGFDAFRRMKGAEPFLEAIVSRERWLLDRLFAGDDAALDRVNPQV